MFRGRIFGAIVMILLIFGLLGIGSYIGWSQGYAAGIVAGDGTDGAFTPGLFYGVGFFPFFFGFGLFFKLALLLLLFLIIGKLFRFWMWGMAGGPQGGPWARHWHKHGPPPRYKDQPAPPEEQDHADAERADTETEV